MTAKVITKNSEIAVFIRFFFFSALCVVTVDK